MKIYTILLITSDKSGSVMAMLQSSHSPQIPRIIIAGGPDALKDAWKQQQDGFYFYDRVCTFLPHDKELLDAKKILGIEDGFFSNKKESPRTCPRCKGRKVDPYHFQDDCQRCGGIGEVCGDESKWSPPQFVD
ncbi:MAG: hypothetical protein NT068_02765 [Candidatus Nomurabacteria bacterium]|nr:hypothetical protein [Candidatus Nomurabacteria bacterium]